MPHSCGRMGVVCEEVNNGYDTEGRAEVAYMVDWSTLSNDLKVCYVIYEFDKVKKEKIWFSKLVRVLDADASKVTISKTIDKLFDLGIIDGKWTEVGGRWTRVLSVTGEAEDSVKAIYESTKRPKA